MGLLDRFKKKPHSEEKGKIYRTHYNEDGSVKSRAEFTKREEIRARLRTKISPETKAKVRKGFKTAAKHYRQFQKETGFGEMPKEKDPMGLGSLFGESASDNDILGGGADILGSPRGMKKRRPADDWDWMR